ncbi:MAG: recombinase family protein [Clostridia bacterium]|jgi:site-specific DNA recombinase|nr:recombinase family protein [Clostridia bacterium]
MPRRKKVNKEERNIWKVGIYCRLSSDDGDNAESDSITNQKEIIEYFLKKEENIEIIDYYQDDGYSGTTFNRPDFKRMFNALVNGDINTIIVKDLSRFGRNYIEVGNYIEQIFPLYNTRFIAVNDNIDSFKDPKSVNNIIVPFKNLMNDEYARDISNKVRSVLMTKSLNGEWVGGTCPYGYKKNPDNIHQLIIDEEEAPVVRKIFKMALDGFGHIKIARFLNDNGILCRKEVQRRKKYKLSMSSEDEEIVYHWSTSTIGKMVTSEIYIGNLVWNRTGSISYKDHRQIYKPKSEWVIVEGTHEGIISVEDFNKIQETIKERLSKKKRPEKLTIYKYKIKCADCGRSMCKMEDFRDGRTSSNFYCRNYKTTSSKCSPHKIKTSELDSMVIEAILMQIKSVLNIEKTINKIKENSKTTNKDEYEKQILKLNNDIDKIKRLKKVAYEDWKLERISKEEFINYSNDYEKSIENLNNEIKVYENKIESSLRDIKEDEYWIEHFRRNKKIKSLSREVIEELIDCIYVHEGGNITIKFKYQDEYERALKSIENEMEVAV